jgi:ATP-dependent exoDNAse (exonuclease V) beta subunit
MLTVYRASAGAGKTHKLTGEYLKLLFASPGAYRRILAVTFTNKATDEMKGRIVQELYTLSSGQKSDYVPVLSSRFGLDEAQVRAQARKVLIAILHYYSAFNSWSISMAYPPCNPISRVNARMVCWKNRSIVLILKAE